MNAPLDALCAGIDLTAEETERLFGELIAGRLSEVELAALLVALKAKGEAPEEIAGAVRALRAAAVPFDRPSYAFADCCGTGGDGLGTVNVSTAAGFVAAAAGLPIAKHGNRSITSSCGSADVLEALGTHLDASPASARRTLDEVGFCFLFAPRYHSGLRHAMPVRKTLRVRTIMNLLGPLVNPAAPPLQLVGVYDAERVVDTARALRLVGCEAALVVHGGGLDEIALHAPTRAARLEHGLIEELTLTPEDAGVKPAPIEALRGGGRMSNAIWLERILAGEGPRAQLDAVAINAGALLWIAGRARSLAHGTAVALELLATRKAEELLLRFVEHSRSAPLASVA